MTRLGSKKTALLIAVPAAAVMLVASMTNQPENEDTAQSAATRSSTTTTIAADPTTTSSPAPPIIDPGDVSKGQPATVARVVDGDTIDVLMGDGTGDTVRLIGINAPETGECFSTQSTAALELLVGGRHLYLVRDVSERGQYERLLRYVFLDDGTFVNGAIVEGGYAIAREYPPDVAMADELGAAQDAAESSGVGLWGDNACGARSDAELSISTIQYDAPGNDNETLDQEWVEILNQGEGPLLLDGWVLKDESASYRFEFPVGFILEGGASVRIVTGCGADTTATLHWCNAGAVWNNDGDTAFLLDPSGNIHASYAYG